MSEPTEPFLVRPKMVALGETHITIEWSDGHRSVFSNRGLRESCPCALCQGEMNPLGGSRSLPMLPDVRAGIRASEYRMIGLYAIAFAWSDGHSTGIYPYDYLLARCECDACMAERPESLLEPRG